MLEGDFRSSGTVNKIEMGALIPRSFARDLRFWDFQSRRDRQPRTHDCPPKECNLQLPEAHIHPSCKPHTKL